MRKFYQITFPRNCGNCKLWFAGRAGIWFQFAIWNWFLIQFYSKKDHMGNKITFSKYDGKRYIGTAWQW